jgi:lipoteichoic acid synthase
MQIVARKYGTEKVINIDREVTLKLIKYFTLFLALNSLKMTLFNFTIMNSHNVSSFFFKIFFSLGISAIIYTFVIKIRSPFVFIILYVAESSYIFSNISYFSYFRNYLHLFQSAALFTEGVGQVKHFTIPVNIKHLVMLIDLPLFIYMLRHYTEINFISSTISSYRKHIVICFLLLISGNEVWNYAHDNSIFKVVKNYAEGEPVIVERYGTVMNNFCDVVFNWGGESLIKQFKYGAVMTSGSVSVDKPNVIAVQVESLDSNIIDKKYKDSYIMPYLNTLAGQSVYYPYVLSYHKAGGTSDTEFSVINSVEPLKGFPSMKLPKYDYPNSMVKAFSSNSYDAFAFHGNIANYYNRDVAFRKMGFKEFYDINKMGFEDIGWGAPDGEVLNYALDKLKNINTPFFSYFITMTSHTPFTGVYNYYNNSNYEDIEDEELKDYYNSFSYVDESIKKFVDRVKKEHSNTYIFIYGDHTPNIDKDEYRQASFMDGNNYLEFVPLFIITPDNKKHIESKEVASFLDIAPTMLKVSGQSFDISTDGRDLLSNEETGKDIPFNGSEYNRETLFKKASKLVP